MLFFILLAILLGIIIFAIYYFVFRKTSEDNLPVTNVTTITNKIEGYDYTLEDRDTEIFNDLFKELKENLESDSINEKLYAENLAKMFIIDLFTIDNKTSKYDIGGLEYILENAKESFRAKILDTIYKTVEDNSYKTRTQKLPIVKSIQMTNLEQTTYQIEENTFSAYEVTLTWEYVEKLGYDTSAKIIMIKEDNKLSIVTYEPEN